MEDDVINNEPEDPKVSENFNQFLNDRFGPGSKQSNASGIEAYLDDRFGRKQ